jgi:hypothetical protein|tara:strand:+ start:298 stop:519 length:222 start_codon:yes stop_codon:yes gene_type:complete
MSKLIRKITIGKDYKIDSMHYSVGQEVYGGHVICDIIEEDDKYSIYIRKEKVVIPWKDFNKNMAISVEYNLEY